jgi:isopentenyl diphosphate isomerase/L-lactate dehydrogenase-like FMN-dependent dehydrogenase
VELIHKEMLVAMALTGCREIADIDRQVLDNRGEQ